jgi:hypothetical protein
LAVRRTRGRRSRRGGRRSARCAKVWLLRELEGGRRSKTTLSRFESLPPGSEAHPHDFKPSTARRAHFSDCGAPFRDPAVRAHPHRSGDLLRHRATRFTRSIPHEPGRCEVAQHSRFRRS